MTFHFEDFVLDPARRELRRAETLVALEPQVFDLLLYLVRNRERTLIAVLRCDRPTRVLLAQQLQARERI